MHLVPSGAALQHSPCRDLVSYITSPLNRRRADRAHLSIAAYPDADTDPDYTLSDLLTDLQHFAVQHAIDYEAAVERARINFGQEQDGEE